MVISSRTPEGDPNVCTICGRDLRLEPSLDTRDGPCPHCGHLLWFPEPPTGPRSARPLSYEAALIRSGKPHFGAFPVELQLRLLQVITALTRKKARPAVGSLTELVSEVTSWEQLVARLEQRSDAAGPEPIVLQLEE